jgi:glucose/arabinose dehydrogenase
MGRSLARPLRGVVSGAVIACVTVSLAGIAAACVGDCAGDGMVSIGDLVTGVNIALGAQPVSACAAMDLDENGRVTVDELLRAVNAALDGCMVTPTPSGGATGTPIIGGTPTLPLPPTNSPTPAPPTPTATPPTVAYFCDLPGSVQTTAPGVSVVPGGPADAPDLSFIHLPVGFCAHFFANVGNARQLRFAPGGELFVASPTKATTGGNGPAGKAAIIVLADDNHDGAAEARATFLSGLPATQGLLFAKGYFYYQDGTKIMRLPYSPGERVAAGDSEEVANITVYTSGIHWPKPLDMADDGTIYVGNGGDEGEACHSDSRPFHGGILKLDGSNGGAPVAKGFRNPISLRCARGHDLCFAIELNRDYSTPLGGREKLVPIRQDDDWGFPCCGTTNKPYSDLKPVPDCSGVASEIGSFFVGNTPFDLDFETGRWPEPWKNHVYVPLHGAYGNWAGASVVAIDFDSMTGQVLPGSDLTGTQTGALSTFATGWDVGVPDPKTGRPANVAFAPDGRLFLGNDVSGDIIWIAPMGLTTPTGAAFR